MAFRALHALAAGAVLGGTLLVATPAFADCTTPGDPAYPCITPGQPGTIPGSGGGGGAGGGGAGGAGGGSASGSGGGAGSLPFTGAEILPLAGTAGVLLVVGTTVLVAGRRRQSES